MRLRPSGLILTCVSKADRLVWPVCPGLVVAMIREFLVFCMHRLIHLPFLCKWMHSVRHNPINPSPWSSLAIHQAEHLLDLPTVPVPQHLLLPSHPP